MNGHFGQNMIFEWRSLRGYSSINGDLKQKIDRGDPQGDKMIYGNLKGESS